MMSRTIGPDFSGRHAAPPPLAGNRSRACARTCPVIAGFRQGQDRKLFREPRSRRWRGEQNDAVIEQRLLNTGVIRGAGGPPVVLTLPETDGALIYTESGAKAPLSQPRQNPGGAELAACDKVLAVCGHENFHSFSDASHAAAKVAVEKRIKCRPDGLAVMFAALA